MSDAMDHDVREVIRRRIEFRERDGHVWVTLCHGDLRALLDAADERDRLAAQVERARALAEGYRADARDECYGGELWSTTASAIEAALDGADNE